jgi:hypothetical protein
VSVLLFPARMRYLPERNRLEFDRPGPFGDRMLSFLDLDEADEVCAGIDYREEWQAAFKNPNEWVRMPKHWDNQAAVSE